MARWRVRGCGVAAGLSVAMVAVGAAGLAAQSPPKQSLDGAPGVSLAAFDVVSVKPVVQGAPMMMMGVQYLPDGIHTGGPVSILIRVAYGGFGKLPTDDSVTGLPDWAKTANFTVDAKMSPEQVTEFNKLDKDAKEERREAMLRAVLEDRFQLKVHREPKQVPDYELVVAKGGPKFKEGGDPDPNGPKDRDGKPIAGSYLMMKRAGQVMAQNLGMESLANFLGSGANVGRMVKDKTGLTGKYSFTLSWTLDAAALGSTEVENFLKAQAEAAGDTSPSIFTAVQEQLGLKLVPGTGSINTVVVDHVERPTVD